MTGRISRRLEKFPPKTQESLLFLSASLSAEEQELWWIDQEINNRGIRIDRTSALAALRLAEKAKKVLDAKMNKYNTNNMAPWDRLTQYFGLASGTGSQGQRATTTTSQPTDIWGKLLGGGLLASQMF